MAIKKTKAQKNRERLEQQQKDSQLLRLKKQIAGIKLFGVSDDAPDYRPAHNPRYHDDSTKQITSNRERGTIVVCERAELSPEMQERERLAQIEKARKAKRVAPAYSKGAYQYITDDTDPKTLGRKL